MKKLFIFLFFLLVILNLIFSSWYLLNNDVNFSADIARDFLLLKEVDEKKFILIGPRSSAGGLYHGPLWTYVNYPAYVIGNGNPLIVGWYWIFLIIIFLVSCYFIAKKLFNRLTAYLFVLMTSLYLIYHAKGLFNPHGAMFLLPSFFYFFIQYIKTLKLRYLIFYLLIAGAMIQFQIAVGGPIMILALVAGAAVALKQNKKKHLIALSLVFLPFTTFILFEIKHNFVLLHSVIRHLGGDPSHGYLFFLTDRMRIMLTGVEFLRSGGIPNANLYVTLITAILLGLQIKANKNRLIYIAFLYFYIGFFFVSLINKYSLLYFYVYPLFPFVFLIFSSMVTVASRYKKIFIILFFAIYTINLSGVINYIKTSTNVIGKEQDTWKFLYNGAKTIYESPDNKFGYFTFSPDILGYGLKYAMAYAGTEYKDKTFYPREKKPITYIIIEPAPSGNPFLRHEWWVQNKLHIVSKPVSTINLANGYMIEKYLLTEEEIKTPLEFDADVGLFYR